MMRISTIIPSYNRADLIGETLRAVLAQTRPPAEVIVVDDGSVDGTPDLVSEQFGKDVILMRQANAGAGPARNAGFARSTGDIVNFMDSDDVPSLNTYEVQARAIEAGADMAYGPWLKTRMDGVDLTPEPLAMQARPAPDIGALQQLILSADWFTVFQPCLFRRTLIEAAGPYREDLKPSEDMEMLYRILARGPRLAHTPETVLLYRVHPENQVSAQNLDRLKIDRANFWTLFQRYAAERGDFTAVQRLLYRIKKIDVARDVRPLDPDRAAVLDADITALDRALQPAFKLLMHLQTKIGMKLHSNAYTRPFGAGPLSAGQKEQIRLLGYQLPRT